MAIKIKLRRDTELNWVNYNPILEEGEPGFETDTLRFKIGNGSSPWNSLNYVKFSGFVSDFEGLDTANVSENVNLYFTNSRTYANVIQLGYSSNSYVNNQLALKANLSGLSTSIVSEGANLYFTNSRVVSALTPSNKVILESNGYITVSVENIVQAGNVASINGVSGVVTLSTANIPEQGNLYYTNQRVYSNIASITKFDTGEANLQFQANGLSGKYVEVVNSPLKVASFTYDVIITQLLGESGQIVYDTSNNVFRGFNGTNWTILG